MRQECAARNIQLQYPSPILCTDNAAMIGAAAYYDLSMDERWNGP